MDYPFVRPLLELNNDARCTLDVLMYLARHPYSYITVDRLAASVGHDSASVEAALAGLRRAGLVVDRDGAVPGAVLLRLVPDEWVPGLVRFASSARGLRHIRLVLNSHRRCQEAREAMSRSRAALRRAFGRS